MSALPTLGAASGVRRGRENGGPVPAGPRYNVMAMARRKSAPEAEEDAPRPHSLQELRANESGCRRCPLYQDATQVVPGEGPLHARFMLVGEQPGDQEDRQGRPFVGPAGRVLDQALDDADIPRDEVFVTNAVKHFKFDLRGKRRLHKKPNVYEIDRCNWWLIQERELIKPRVIVALGATAGRALLGRTVTIGRLRGLELPLDEARLVVTMHPSALLRTQDEADKRAKYQDFVADLRFARKVAEKLSR